MAYKFFLLLVDRVEELLWFWPLQVNGAVIRAGQVGQDRQAGATHVTHHLMVGELGLDFFYYTIFAHSSPKT